MTKGYSKPRNNVNNMLSWILFINNKRNPDIVIKKVANPHLNIEYPEKCQWYRRTKGYSKPRNNINNVLW
jgi:hypothetical protein